MAEIEDANKLFAQIGALAPVTAVVFNEKELSWIIQMGEDTEVLAAYDTRSGQVIFSTALGKPDSRNADRVNQLLLKFSYLWRDTGGFFGAIDERDAPVMMFRCALAGLQPNTLAGLLDALMQQRTAWSQLIARDEQEIDTRAFMPVGGIRV